MIQSPKVVGKSKDEEFNTKRVYLIRMIELIAQRAKIQEKQPRWLKWIARWESSARTPASPIKSLVIVLYTVGFACHRLYWFSLPSIMATLVAYASDIEDDEHNMTVDEHYSNSQDRDAEGDSVDDMDIVEQPEARRSSV